MDLQWAEAKLVAYLDLCRAVAAAVPPGEYWNDTAAALNRQAELMLSTVQQILRRLSLDELNDPLKPPNYAGSDDTEERVRRALGALRDRAELEQKLAPQSPDLAADHLHPTVWNAAALTWDTAQYRVAVGQAALSLATHIKVRAESPLNDRKLMQDVFASEPPKAGSVRLQFPGDRADDSWRSRQQGLQLLAQGAYAGIRNISAHLDENWSEQEALEYLATLSVVARWADATEVVRG